MDRKRFRCLNGKGQEQLFLYEKQDAGVMLIGYVTDNVRSVAIPSAIEGDPVISIGDNGFFCHSEIESVDFPNTLKRIGAGAFAMCRSIRELVLPDSVEEIGMFAFRDCNGLTKVILPRHLKVLRNGVFAFCGLSPHVDMQLPKDLETIETHAFYGAGLFDLVIPDSVKEIQANAFGHLGPNPIMPASREN